MKYNDYKVVNDNKFFFKQVKILKNKYFYLRLILMKLDEIKYVCKYKNYVLIVYIYKLKNSLNF